MEEAASSSGYFFPAEKFEAATVLGMLVGPSAGMVMAKKKSRPCQESKPGHITSSQ
jgi:hypothetical protein